MPKRMIYLVILAVWTVGVLLAAYFLKDVIGGRFKEHWLLMTSTVLCALTLFVEFLRWVSRLALGKSSSTDGVVADNSIALAKGNLPMSDNPNIDYKVVNVNQGSSYHNTPGGMMNFGPVTVNQNFGAQQNFEESPQDEPQKMDVEPITKDETIDINGLIDFAANLKPPGISRNTIDNILKKAGIKPCATEKDGRTIRNLYPCQESQAAIASYLADKS